MPNRKGNRMTTAQMKDPERDGSAAVGIPVHRTVRHDSEAARLVEYLKGYPRSDGTDAAIRVLLEQAAEIERGAAALTLLKRIRYHAERHALPRDWLTAADEVLGTWWPVKLDHPELKA